MKFSGPRKQADHKVRVSSTKDGSRHAEDIQQQHRKQKNMQEACPIQAAGQTKKTRQRLNVEAGQGSRVT